MPRLGFPATSERYDLWVKPDDQDRCHVVAAVAVLLGLDLRLARKILESSSPLRRKVRRREAEFIRDRFADWGVVVRVEPDLPERPSEPKSLERLIGMAEVESLGCFRALLGLLIGGCTAMVLSVNDPFKVTYFTEPQGMDMAERIVAFDRWRGSIGFQLGTWAMAWIPLLASGLVGVFAHASLPTSIPSAMLRTACVASLLSAAWWVGEPVVERALGTGGSSDIQAGVAGLAFSALCISLSAPLSSAVVRRRSSGNQLRPADYGRRIG